MVTVAQFDEKTLLAKFGPPKMEKMDFWPNLDLPDLAKHGWGLPQYPPTIPHMPFSWRIQ